LKHQANSAQQEKFVSDGEICNAILARKPAQPMIINDAKIVVKETWNSLMMVSSSGGIFCQNCSQRDLELPADGLFILPKLHGLFYSLRNGLGYFGQLKKPKSIMFSFTLVSV
jgi:hypothetical protein